MPAAQAAEVVADREEVVRGRHVLCARTCYTNRSKLKPSQLACQVMYDITRPDRMMQQA